MILREGDGRFVERPRLEAEIDVAGKGVERWALRLGVEARETIGVELGQLRRDVHQLRTVASE